MDWEQALDALLRKVQEKTNNQLARQYDRLIDGLHDFLDDLFNYPLVEDWRQSLARFAEHWADRGLILTHRTLAALEKLIAEHIGGSIAVALAAAPEAAVPASDVRTDVAPSMAPASNPSPKDDAAEENREYALRRAARQFAEEIQRKLGLTDDERTHYEFHVYENLRRQQRGWPLLPPPDYILDKHYAYQQMLARQPSIGGITKEQAERSQKAVKYAHYWELPPEEREKLDREALREEKRKFQSEYGWAATFFNPGFDGTGTFNDLLIISSGVGGMPGLTGRRTPMGPLVSPIRRGRPRVSQPPAQPPVPPRRGRAPRKPPFPPPAARVRVSNRSGNRPPHPSHVLAVNAEEANARFIHTLPFEVVLFWGLKAGAHGADVVSYNLKTKIVTIWDVKWRSDPVRIQASSTFKEGSKPLAYALQKARDAIYASGLSKAHRDAAIKSIATKSFRKRTLGDGHAKNSVVGD